VNHQEVACRAGTISHINTRYWRQTSQQQHSTCRTSNLDTSNSQSENCERQAGHEQCQSKRGFSQGRTGSRKFASQNHLPMMAFILPNLSRGQSEIPSGTKFRPSKNIWRNSIENCIENWLKIGSDIRMTRAVSLYGVATLETKNMKECVKVTERGVMICSSASRIIPLCNWNCICKTRNVNNKFEIAICKFFKRAKILIGSGAGHP